MFRVPANPNRPTYDDTINIGLWRWLTSSAADRKEWTRRRNVAAQTAETNQLQQQQARSDEARADLERAAEQARATWQAERAKRPPRRRRW